AGGAIDQVDAELSQDLPQRNRILDRPATVDPVRARKAEKQRVLLRPDFAHRHHSFTYHANAVGKCTAVFVGALIAERREKRMQQITMRSVKLNHFRTSGFSAARSSSKRLKDGCDLGFAQPAWGLITVRERNGTGRKNRRPSAAFGRQWLAAFPWFHGAGFASGVRKLDPRNRALLFDARKSAPQRLNLLVAPQAEVRGTDSAIGGHCSRFRQHGSSASHSAAAQMH